MLSGYVAKLDVARQRAEERNSFSNQHWHASDYKSLNRSHAEIAES
jgi:hypothetical protein